jgi:hypothetical protein
VASAPTTFSVLALPAEGRPGNFSGAVGTFQVSSELSGVKTVAGDPLTLRLHITGAGNFDRINDVMLTDIDHWKTYQSTSTFKASDDIGFRGEKTFEQPVIAADAGTQSLPGLTFSYFDPKTRRYESAKTEPLSVAVSPAPAGSAVASMSQAGAERRRDRRGAAARPARRPCGERFHGVDFAAPVFAAALPGSARRSALRARRGVALAAPRRSPGKFDARRVQARRA